MPKPQPKIEIVPIEALRPQAKNYRQHTPRNIAMIGDSIQEVGVMRSVVSDGDNADELVAGSGTLDAAMERGITQAIIVETDGTALLVHRRRGLTEEQKVRYSIEDNRATDLSGWDTVALAELADTTPALLDNLFHTEELAQILERAGTEIIDADALWQGMPEFENKTTPSWKQLIVHFENEADYEAFARLVGQALTPQTKSMWYPPHQRQAGAPQVRDES